MASNLQFGRGAIENRQAVRVICHVGNESEGDNPTTTLLKWNGRGKPFSFFKLPWVANGLAMMRTPKPNVMVLNSDGVVGFGYGTFDQEVIDPSNAGPDGRGPLSDLRCVGDRVFAVGMSRQVYERGSQPGWKRVDQGLVLDLGEVKVAGLKSIDGPAPDRVWAVGYGGEIWARVDGIWHQEDSPTNVVLHRVISGPGKPLFACGQLGLLLKNDGAGWRILTQEKSVSNFWDMAWFGDNLYVASENALFVLSGEELVPVVVAGVATFGHLDSADGVLWSFGTEQICWTDDGSTWQDETPK